MKVKDLNWHLCTQNNDCYNQCKLVFEYTLDLFNETCLQQSGTFSSLFLERPGFFTLLHFTGFTGLLEHLGFSEGPMKSFRALLEHLGVSGGPMKSFGGGLEHLGAASYQVIPPRGQGWRDRLKHNKLACLKKSKKSKKITGGGTA